MFSLSTIQEKQIFIGNLLFVACCGFYLAWWLLAFKPSNPITGIKTGWLLIPASIAGLLGVIWILRSILGGTPSERLLSGWYILLGGIAFYLILLTVTVWLLKRPATSELILIVGWGMLALVEMNALFGFGLFSRGRSVGFIVIVCAAIIISLVCYVLYYRLDRRAGYIDSMIPLLLAALTMVGISCFMMVPNQ